MTAHERREFYYSELRTGFTGILFFLGGAFFVGLMLGHLLGLVHVKFEGDPADMIPFALIMGLVFMVLGLWQLSKFFDRRPVIVIAREGLFYRPHGDSFIPWRDIQALKRDKRGDNDYVILSQQSAPEVKIDLSLLHGGIGKDPIYCAIMEARQSQSG